MVGLYEQKVYDRSIRYGNDAIIIKQPPGRLKPEKILKVVDKKFIPSAQSINENMFQKDVLGSKNVRKRGSKALPPLVDVLELFHKWEKLSPDEQSELIAGQPYVGREFIMAIEGMSISDALNSNEHSARIGGRSFLKANHDDAILLCEVPTEAFLAANNLNFDSKNFMIAMDNWVVEKVERLGDSYYLIKSKKHSADRAGLIVGDDWSSTGELEMIFGKNSSNLPVFTYSPRLPYGVDHGVSMGLVAGKIGVDIYGAFDYPDNRAGEVWLPCPSDTSIGVLEVKTHENVLKRLITYLNGQISDRFRQGAIGTDSHSG